MFTSIFRAGTAALMLGSASFAAWGEKPPLEYDISPKHVAIFDVATDGEQSFAAGERGVLLTSSISNPGSWSSMRLPVTQSITGIALGDGDNAVVVGHGGTILFTEDSGLTWESVDVSEHSRGDPFMDVSYLGNDRYLAVGAFGLVMSSENGGRSWSATSISEDYFDRHLYSIVKAGSDWLLIGESGSLFASADQGDSWTKLESPYEGSFFGGMGTPNGAWLLYGMRGQVWRSEDRGQSWQQSQTDTKVAFNAHETNSSGNVLVFGNGGQVLISEDDGKTFAPATRTGVPGDITAVARVNGELLLGSTAGIRLWQEQGE